MEKYSKYINYIAIALVTIILGIIVGNTLIGDVSIPSNNLQSIKISIWTRPLSIGETNTAKIEFYPEDAKKEEITWFSNNESIASVENGIIMGKSPGTTTIRAVSKSGLWDTVTITVYKKAETITIDKETVELKIGEKVQLNATVLPEDAEVKWTTSNESIAKVNNGLIEATGAGIATIKISDKGNNYKECKVTVREKTPEEIRAEKEAEKQTFINSCQSYNYKDIFRNSENYYGKNAKFTGKVIQVIEGSSLYKVRMNVTIGSYGYYSDTIMAFIPKSAMSGRILEDDIITIYGNLGKLYTYDTVLGSTMTIPSIDVLYANLVK